MKEAIAIVGWWFVFSFSVVLVPVTSSESGDGKNGKPYDSSPEKNKFHGALLIGKFFLQYTSFR